MTSVYRKKTHTDRYLYFDSHYPNQHKASVVRTLYSRANAIPTQASDIVKEQKHLYATLHEWNGYPKPFIAQYKTPVPKKNEGKESMGFATLP